MRQTLSHRLQECQTCQSIKPSQQNVGYLNPIQVAAPFELVGWDLMGPFPTSMSGNRYMVIAKYLTKWCEATPLLDSTASTIALALLHKVIFQHGCPQKLLSDQGKQFTSQVLQILTSFLGVQQVFTSPYHPRRMA
ncbi:hypothetical protein GOP47_0006637 [Adiantum capillus-veneris]|uniref:Integrase catalytic domain-containing protein n=1 Tax=Adiantum capillus-veneris TaxID=13818 RepID=A0A9D4V403_ADICA|nr:hypothetical protein GOP47_0006637 [Adiantum capillus-veneris]